MTNIKEENIKNICIVLGLCIIFLPYILHQKMLQKIYNNDLNIIILVLICAGLLFIDTRIGILFLLLFIFLGLKARYNTLYNFVNEIKYSNQNEELNVQEEDVSQVDEVKETFFRGNIPVNNNAKLEYVEPFTGVKKVKQLQDNLKLKDDHQEGISNETQYGSPLSKCSNYDLKNYSKIGTYFYPMN